MSDEITCQEDLNGMLPSEIVAEVERLRQERDAANARAARADGGEG